MSDKQITYIKIEMNNQCTEGVTKLVGGGGGGGKIKTVTFKCLLDLELHLKDKKNIK